MHLQKGYSNGIINMYVHLMKNVSITMCLARLCHVCTKVLFGNEAWI